MAVFLRRQLPILLAFLFGAAMLIRYYVPHPVSETIYNKVLEYQNAVVAV